MLPPASTLNAAILALAPSADRNSAIMIFVNTICDYVDQVQATGGHTGILAMNRMAMYNIFVTQDPVIDTSWIAVFAESFYQGAFQGTITPGTVTNAAWSGGSTTDTLTAPAGGTTITTLAAARSLLESELLLATYNNNPALPFATAIRDATLAFMFMCVGLDSNSHVTPVTLAAQ